MSKSLLSFMNRQWFAKHLPLIAIIVIAVGVGLLIYGPTVNLPLFLDDAAHFRWLLQVRINEIWFTSAGAPFYRPMTFVVFKLLWLLQGSYNAPTLHALIVSLHIANGILIGVLARRLSAHAWIGPIATTLFIVFPFSYQAVIPSASLFHPMLAFGALGASVLTLRYFDHGGIPALIGTWMLAFIGIFSHEDGVVLPALIILIVVTAHWQALRSNFRPHLRRLLLIFIPILALALIYFAIWLVVPKANDSGGLQVKALDVKLADTAQALIYPVSAIIHPANLALIGIGVVVAILILITPRSRIAVGAGLLWFAIATIPAVALLGVDYFLAGPRLFYLGSIGLSLAWAAWIVGLAEVPLTPAPSPRKDGEGEMQQVSKYLPLKDTVGARRLRPVILSLLPFPVFTGGRGRGLGGFANHFPKVIGVAVIALLVGVGAVFSFQRVADSLQMGSFYHAVLHETTTDTPALFVNVPSYIAPRKATFTLGVESDPFLADYISLQNLVWVNTGIDRPINTISFANTLVENPGWIISPRGPSVGWDGLDHALNNAQRVYSVQFSTKSNTPPFRLVKAGEVLQIAPSSPPIATYPGVTLERAYLSSDPLTVNLEWASTGPSSATVFVHVLCDGKLAAQVDGAPLYGLHPFDRWKVGERWRDQREIGSEFGTTCPQIGSIEVGLYDPATGQRLTATRPDGTTTDTIDVSLKP